MTKPARAAEERPYTSNVTKAGALLNEARVLLDWWQPELSVDANFDRVRTGNLLGARSHAQAALIAQTLRRRYFDDPELGAALLTFARHPAAANNWLNFLLYFFALQDDLTLRSLMLNVVYPYRWQGLEATLEQAFYYETCAWSDCGLTARRWSRATSRQTSRSAAQALREFGALSRGRMSNPPLPAFAFIAFWLRRRNASGMNVLSNYDWKLFLLEEDDVERRLLDAHQWKLLEYFAAGSTIRIGFPAESLEAYAKWLTTAPAAAAI